MTETHTIGRYRIDGSIGEGAMAHVYLAYDPSIDRSVAIKVLKPEFRDNAEIVARFLSESRAAGMLSHANIVTIFDVGTANNAPYIAMERVSGRPLDELLAEQGRLPSERAALLASQLADALAFAHDQGVVHRDIKPSNILICDGGRTAKILDFGIARIDGRDTAGQHSEAQRTQAGQVLGTPRYMSPEQALGLPADARSDLFSLGVVLYEMITGKVAFNGAGLATLAIQIAQEQPAPLDRQVPDCPKGLRFIVEKLLAKKPEQRFPDAMQVATALRREMEASETDASGSRRGLALRYKFPLILAGTCLLSLSAGTSWVVARENQVMQNMALTAGSSMTTFVARNAALRVADNAGLPAAEQDWVPLQAFALTAATGGNIRRLVIVDDQGIIRAGSQSNLVGTRYRPAQGEPALTRMGASQVSEASDGFRFVQNVRYAGSDFGKVDVVVSREELDAAQRSAKFLLAGLAALVTLVVAAFGFVSARLLTQPLRRLRQGMDDVTAGNLSFRFSHNRGDEIGGLFDAMNRMVASIAERLDTSSDVLADARRAMLMTRVETPPSQDKRVA